MGGHIYGISVEGVDAANSLKGFANGKANWMETQ